MIPIGSDFCLHTQFSQQRHRMSCHFAPISQGSFTSVLFLICYIFTSNKMSKMTYHVPRSMVQSQTPHLQHWQLRLQFKPGSTCQLAAGSCDAWLFFFFQRKRLFWPINFAFKYALTCLWQLFSDINNWAFGTATSRHQGWIKSFCQVEWDVLDSCKNWSLITNQLAKTD